MEIKLHSLLTHELPSVRAITKILIEKRIELYFEVLIDGNSPDCFFLYLRNNLIRNTTFFVCYDKQVSVYYYNPDQSPIDQIRNQIDYAECGTIIDELIHYLEKRDFLPK